MVRRGLEGFIVFRGCYRCLEGFTGAWRGLEVLGCVERSLEGVIGV